MNSFPGEKSAWAIDEAGSAVIAQAEKWLLDIALAARGDIEYAKHLVAVKDQEAAAVGENARASAPTIARCSGQSCRRRPVARSQSDTPSTGVSDGGREHLAVGGNRQTIAPGRLPAMTRCLAAAGNVPQADRPVIAGRKKECGHRADSGRCSRLPRAPRNRPAARDPWRRRRIGARPPGPATIVLPSGKTRPHAPAPNRPGVCHCSLPGLDVDDRERSAVGSRSWPASGHPVQTPTAVPGPPVLLPGRSIPEPISPSSELIAMSRRSGENTGAVAPATGLASNVSRSRPRSQSLRAFRLPRSPRAPYHQARRRSTVTGSVAESSAGEAITAGDIPELDHRRRIRPWPGSPRRARRRR